MTPYRLTDDQALVVRGVIAGMSWLEIGVICGWSVSKSYSAAKTIEKIVGRKRSEFGRHVDLSRYRAPIQEYRVRTWSTTSCGKVDIRHLRAEIPSKRPKSEPIVMKKATIHSIKSSAWWACLSPGDIFSKVGSVEDSALIGAGKDRGYVVSRMTEDDGSPIIGRGTYGVESAPRLPDRIVMVLESAQRSRSARLYVIAEAFGLDVRDDINRIRDAVIGDERLKLCVYRDKPAARLAK